MGQTEPVREDEEVGEMDVCVALDLELGLWEWEWQEGVLRAMRPAERAMWRRGTGGRERSALWVDMKRLERVVQREGL